MGIFLFIFLLGGALLLVSMIYYMFRIEMVYRFRMRELHQDLESYIKLPSFDYMTDRFWVWPLDKFKEKNK